MANYMTIAKLVNFLPKCEGASTRMRLSGKQLTQMMDKVAQKEPELGEVLRIQLGRAKNPVLEIGAKAKSNYSIAGFRLFDGKKVVQQGAVSLSNVGTNQSVVKFHNSLGRDILGSSRPLLGSKGLAEGQSGIARGFLDCGKPTNAKDIAAAISKKQGMVTANAHIGENFGINAIVRENELVRMLRDIPMDASGKARLERELERFDLIRNTSASFSRSDGKINVNFDGLGFGHLDFKVDENRLVNAARILDVNPKFLERYTEGSKNLQRSLDAVMVDIRKALRGEAIAPAYKGAEPATAETFAKVSDAVKPLDLGKAFEAKTLACDEKILKFDKIGLKDFQAKVDEIKNKYKL